MLERCRSLQSRPSSWLNNVINKAKKACKWIYNLVPKGSIRIHLEMLVRSSRRPNLSTHYIWETCGNGANPRQHLTPHAAHILETYHSYGKKTSGAEKYERLDTPAPQPEDEEMVKVNPRPSVRTQTALERMLAGSCFWCRMSSTPPRQIWSAFQRHKSFLLNHRSS